MWQQVVRLAGGALQGPATRLASRKPGRAGMFALVCPPHQGCTIGLGKQSLQPVSQRLRSVSGDALTLSVDALELERPRNANLMSSLQCAVRAKT